MVEIVNIGSEQFLDSAFSIRNSGKEFGWMCHRPDDVNYSFMWNGNLDFSTLETSALHTLPEVFGGAAGIREGLYCAKRNLLIHGDHELVQHNPAERKIIGRFNTSPSKKLRPDNRNPLLSFAQFARYDISIANQDGLELMYYCFTAVNPNYSGGEPSEIAIRQPISQGFQRNLLNFVANTHEDVNALRDVDIDVASKSIQDFLESR